MVHLPSTPGRRAQLRGVAAHTSGGFAVYKPEQYMLSIILSLYTLALPWEVERVLHSESSLEVLGLQSLHGHHSTRMRVVPVLCSIGAVFS